MQPPAKDSLAKGVEAASLVQAFTACLYLLQEDRQRPQGLLPRRGKLRQQHL